MEKKRLQIDIVIHPEGEGDERVYSISAVQVPNVVTQGKTVDEAKRMLREALELYFEEAPWERENLIELVAEEESNPPMITRLLL